MRKPLIALVAAALLGAAGCSSTSTTTPTAAAPSSAAPAPSPSPSVDVAANTKKICEEATNAVNEDQGKALGTQIGLMIGARKAHKASVEAGAKTSAKAIVNGWVTTFRNLATTAADPKLAAALKKTADGLAVIGTDAFLAKLKSTADTSKLEKQLDTAGAPMAAFCP